MELLLSSAYIRSCSGASRSWICRFFLCQPAIDIRPYFISFGMRINTVSRYVVARRGLNKIIKNWRMNTYKAASGLYGCHDRTRWMRRKSVIKNASLELTADVPLSNLSCIKQCSSGLRKSLEVINQVLRRIWDGKSRCG